MPRTIIDIKLEVTARIGAPERIAPTILGGRRFATMLRMS